MGTEILVTGATGTVGSHVVSALADTDVSFKAGVRDPTAGDWPENCEPIAFDFERPETWGFAFDGIDTLFLLRPPSVGRDRLVAAVDAAIRMGVEHVTYLSVLGAARNPLLPHRRLERHLETSGATYTFLRASYFMQNLSEIHAPEIREHDEVFVPAGTGAVSFVDARDVGAVAALTMREPGHEDESYDLTGPEALDFETVAERFSDVLGRPVTYTDPSSVAFVRRMYARGVPLRFAVLMLGIYAPARFGRAGRVEDDVERLLDRPATSLSTFVSDYREVWEADE
ncbi:Uncharacterized conserved protein YbjT, contains NAD(P)-binding and DUF2867 domains [Halogranum rubrum]|uniref:Uncharacterized conserved protein YbjT, contains NAD(P)-binding and DUF2867 domains n=1 Tax=Halogranum rubrum TaxID=553466 RepID=A0A1I4CW08_9EURY|nr:SDR family oxidoreductase [Halogranum rubrum]SFK84810.1 Uncharacterized conserved protein YbjT, contains NAD(P)-binding and DUF2867 domains [Halogranum rubrum]